MGPALPGQHHRLDFGQQDVKNALSILVEGESQGGSALNKATVSFKHFTPAWK